MPSRLIPLVAFSFAAACAGAGFAHAQMYKWVDGRGVVNYSNEPPKDGSAQKAVPVQERISTYSNEPNPAPNASTGASAPAQPDAVRERVESLERQLEQDRRRRATSAEDEERRRRAHDECVRSRRVDCDQLEMPVGVAPAVVIVPARRSNIVPTLPLPARAARHRSRAPHPVHTHEETANVARRSVLR